MNEKERGRITDRFKSVCRLGIRPGTKGEMEAAAAAALRMVERYPWLRDYARLLGIKMPGPHTEDMPFPNKKKPAGAPPPPPRWSKPRTERGYIYKQCHKPTCRCMNGGAWHGPYRYQSKRDGAQVHSEYVGKRKP